MHASRSFLASIALVTLLSGCAAAPAAPSPSMTADTPAASPAAASPSVTPTPAPSPDALPAEAETLVRAYYVAWNRFLRTGQDDGSLAPLVSGEAAGQIKELVADHRSHARRYVGGDLEPKYVVSGQQHVRAGNDYAVIACTDAREARVFERGKDTGPGEVARELLHLKRDGGALTIVLLQVDIEATTC